MIAWYNGAYTPIDEVSLHPMDRGFLLGDGLFETLTLNKGHPVYLEAHLQRLQKSADTLRCPFLINHNDIKNVLSTLIVKNELEDQQVSARITLSRGVGPRGLVPPSNPSPNILITVAPAPADFPPVTLKTVSLRRNELSPTSQMKTLCYMDNILAMEEAQSLGGGDGLMLNTKDNIAETTICNIFFVQNDHILTPKVSDGCLPGVMRDAVIRACRTLGIECVERSIAAVEITSFDSAFVTNSLCRIRQVCQIDDQTMHKSALIGQLSEFIQTDERSS